MLGVGPGWPPLVHEPVSRASPTRRRGRSPRIDLSLRAVASWLSGVCACRLLGSGLQQPVERLSWWLSGCGEVDERTLSQWQGGLPESE